MRVKTVRQEGAVSLVEWLDAGGYHRTVLPSELISGNGRCAIAELNRGAVHGERWSEIMDFSITANDIEQELYRVGVWTAEDILDNPEAVRGAIQKVLQDTLVSLFRFATGKGV